MAFEWNGTRVASGSKAFVEVPVCTMASGYELTLPVHILAGRKAGPSALIATGSHGDQLWETEMCRNLYHRVLADDYDFAGTLVLCPLLNPIAYEYGARNTWVDMHNLNRVFPGSESGKNWFTDMLAGVITREILPKVDYVLDYHGGSNNTIIHYTYTADPNGSNLDRQVHELALASGAEVLWEHFEARGTLTNAAAELGKVALVLEMGGGGVFQDGEYLSRGVEDTINVLRVPGMFPGRVSNAGPRVVVRKGTTVRPRNGGTFIPVVGVDQIGKTVAEGTVLGRVVSPHTFDVLDELVAPYPKTELMQIRNRISRVHPGAYAYIMGDGDSGYTIS